MGACILQANQESTAAGKNRVAAVDGEKRVTQNEMFILNVALRNSAFQNNEKFKTLVNRIKQHLRTAVTRLYPRAVMAY